MEKDAKIYVAGHRGLVGSAIVRALQKDGYTNICTRTHAELDLTRQADVELFFATEQPMYVFLAAAKVGGIMANTTYPADFIRENLVVQTNVIDSAHRHGVQKLLFLGSSCVYPKLAPQPIKEAYLLTSALEPTNQAYAIAKIAGIIMAQSYTSQYGMQTINVMPTNLYGPNDNFDLTSSHVLPAMIRKFDDAKKSSASIVELWGTGSSQREFLHVDDLAGAVIFLMNTYENSEIINIGTGEDIAIRELAQMIKDIVGYEGEIVWDRTKPDGTPRKLLDVSQLHTLGWKHTISLADGIRQTYAWYQQHEQLRK